MQITLIAAMSHGRIIGNQGSLPWPRISEDLRLFRQETIGKVLIMGRKTFDDICTTNGGPLDQRMSVVLSRKKQSLPETCRSATTKTEAIEFARILGYGTDEIMVIGGASIFGQFIDDAHRLYLTFINHKFPGDVTFPKINHRKWRAEWISHLDESAFPCKQIVFARR